MKNDDIVITSAFRTAIGSFRGSLSSQTAPQLGGMVIKKCLEHSKLKSEDVDMVYMGQVLTTGSGQNPARQAAIHAGISKEKTATTINQVCGSGLASIALAFNSIKCEDGNIIIAGGQESMSNSPHYIHMRDGIKMGDRKMQDSMIVDGLWDIYNQYHMGITAENVAEKFQVTREQQDEFAYNSQLKASKAKAAGLFKDEITPVDIVTRKETTVFDQDEYIKDNVQLEKLASLRPAFAKDGSVTAANASGGIDGVRGCRTSVILITTKSWLEKILTLK